MDETDTRRLRLLQRIEQLQAGLSREESTSIRDARTILARVSIRGSPQVLAQVFAGIILVWDSTDWDGLGE